MDITRIAEEVLGLFAAEGFALSDDLGKAETTLRDLALRIGAKALELHLAKTPLGYEGSSRPCQDPDCSCNLKFVGYRRRTVATLLGSVTFKRAYYHSSDCGASCCPYDQKTGLGSGQLSPGLAKAVTLAAAVDPFIPAATLVKELTGQRVGDRTIHRVARKVGKMASQKESEMALKMATWSIPVGNVEAQPLRLYVAVDGVMVHRKDWNEAKCVCCYWEQPDGRGGVRRQSRYAVRFESAEQFKAFVWSLTMQCGLETAAEVILLGDGAVWIWDHVAGVLGEKTVCITDWYHVMEHIWACGKKLHGEGTPQTTAWVKERETLLWEGQYQTLVTMLHQERKQTRSMPNREALEGLAGYLERQGQRLSYDRFRSCGYDIGSGRVESACKHVVGSRMKRSGMIWSDQGAQEILSLRTAYLNGRWESLWNSNPLRKAIAA